MLLRKLSSSLKLYAPKRTFGAIVKKEYDWRDDASRNPDITLRDPRYMPDQINVDEMPMPYYREPDDPTPVIPNRPFDDLTLNYNHTKACNNIGPCYEQYASYWNADADVAHEIDYGSEDLDFQPDCFKTQHFKKKGFIWPFALVGLLPFIYFMNEYFNQGLPDRDHWKRPLPPPTNHPDEEDTPDTKLYEVMNTYTGRTLMDSGMFVELNYDMVDGKKVFKRFSGVNDYMSPVH